jgi:hypothetical protein
MDFFTFLVQDQMIFLFKNPIQFFGKKKSSNLDLKGV